MSKDAVLPSSTNYWYSLSCFPTTTRRRRHLSAGLPSHPPAYALRGLAHSRYFGTSLRFFGTDVPNSQHRGIHTPQRHVEKGAVTVVSTYHLALAVSSSKSHLCLIWKRTRGVALMSHNWSTG